jgi:hypothetical protein
VTAAALGMPFYPGAVALRNQVAGAQNRRTAVVQLLTPDGVERVYRWYKQRLPGPVSKDQLDTRAEPATGVLMSNDRRRVLSLWLTRRGEQTLIQITRIDLAQPKASSR